MGGAVHCTGSNANAYDVVSQDDALEAARLFTLRFKIGSRKGENVTAVERSETAEGEDVTKCHVWGDSKLLPARL